MYLNYDRLCKPLRKILTLFFHVCAVTSSKARTPPSPPSPAKPSASPVPRSPLGRPVRPEDEFEQVRSA